MGFIHTNVREMQELVEVFQLVNFLPVKFFFRLKENLEAYSQLKCMWSQFKKIFRFDLDQFWKTKQFSRPY